MPALLEAVALAVHLQDVNSVSEAVQQGAGQSLRAEDLGPLVEGQVGGDQDRTSLVALAEDLEGELRASLREWDEAELVDDEQLESGKLLLEVEQPSLVPGLDQLVDQRGGGGEADRQPPLAGGESQAEGHMGLAGPTVADSDDVLTPVYVLAACQLHDQVLVHRRHGQEVEGVEALGGGEARSLDPAVHHAMMAVYQLKL